MFKWGGGEEAMSLIYSEFKNAGTSTSSTYTYTFTNDMKHGYVFITGRNIAITTTGTSTELYTSSGTSTYEIKNVKSGDTIQYTTLNISGNGRAAISIIGD